MQVMCFEREFRERANVVNLSKYSAKTRQFAPFAFKKGARGKASNGGNQSRPL